MPEERKVYLFEFSPDGGKRWFPFCNANGQRLWSSHKKVPNTEIGWRTNLRYVETTVNFDVVPDGFDAGVYGAQSMTDDDQDWCEDRTVAGVRFCANDSGFTSIVQAKGHQYILKRPSIVGEPIWQLIADVMDWYDDTFKVADERGMKGRNVEVTVDGKNPVTGEEAAVTLGSEFRLWQYLHSWMARVGGKPWSETA